MKFSVCTDAVYGEIATPDAMEKVNALGIDTIEFWGWWDKDIDKILEKKNELGMSIAAICTRFISLTEPDKRNEYISGLKETIEIAKKIGTNIVISQTGNDTGDKREKQHKNLVEGLRACVPILEEAGMVLVVEPLNTYIDHAGYYLYSSKEAFDIIDEVSSDNVKVLFDMYHQQIMEGNLLRNIMNNIDKIGHFHAAGNPGRHELDLGEIDYDYIFKELKRSPYNGYIGLEYNPVYDPEVGIKKLLK